MFRDINADAFNQRHQYNDDLYPDAMLSGEAVHLTARVENTEESEQMHSSPTGGYQMLIRLK